MKSAESLLGSTILDLCEETYHDPLGYKAHDLLMTPTGPRAAIIVCLNALVKDNGRTYEMLVEDYNLFTVGDFHSSIKLQSIFDMSTIMNQPVAGFVKDYEQKSFVIASTQKLWVDWLSIIFLQGGSESDLQNLSPYIIAERNRILAMRK